MSEFNFRKRKLDSLYVITSQGISQARSAIREVATTRFVLVERLFDLKNSKENCSIG